MPGTLNPTSVSTKQQRIAQWARQMPQKALTTLSHHLDLEWMVEAYRRTRKDGAVGIDGQTAREFEAQLESNLQSLRDRAKSGDYYRAPAVRRVYIPKGDGSQRPLGTPTFADKVLQRAVVMLLEPLYEQDFLDCSFGFRPRRSAHQALAQVRSGLMRRGGGWVLDVDIRGFFDTLSHGHLRQMLAKRMRDGVIKRLIGKWLKAGVLDGGVLTHADTGTPQGGVISPLLANLYLHEVLDVWFEQEVKPRLRGDAFLVRYADDAVLGFDREDDARRVLAVLSKRFGKFGLTLHPEKTRLLDFRRPGTRQGPDDAPGLASFDLLGFTHYWAKSRQGSWVVKQKTSKSRFTKALQRVRTWCRVHRHLAVGEQREALAQKLRGHYGYYGVIGNSHSLGRYYYEVCLAWRKWLSRRSQTASLDWPSFNRLLQRYPLPLPRLPRPIMPLAANL